MPHNADSTTREMRDDIAHECPDRKATANIALEQKSCKTLQKFSFVSCSLPSVSKARVFVDIRSFGPIMPSPKDDTSASVRTAHCSQ